MRLRPKVPRRGVQNHGNLVTRSSQLDISVVIAGRRGIDYTAHVVRLLSLSGLIPCLVTVLRTGLIFAWRVFIAAKMVGVPKSLGYMLTVGRSIGRTEITIVTMLALGIRMVGVEELVFRPLVHYTDAWPNSSR